MKTIDNKSNYNNKFSFTKSFSVVHEASREYFLIKIRPPWMSAIERVGLSLKEEKHTFTDVHDLHTYCQNVNLSSLFTFTCLFNVVSLAYDISTLPVVGNVIIWNVQYDQVQRQNQSQTKPKTKQCANDKLKESFLKET